MQSLFKSTISLRNLVFVVYLPGFSAIMDDVDCTNKNSFVLAVAVAITIPVS